MDYRNTGTGWRNWRGHHILYKHIYEDHSPYAKPLNNNSTKFFLSHIHNHTHTHTTLTIKPLVSLHVGVAVTRQFLLVLLHQVVKAVPIPVLGRLLCHFNILKTQQNNRQSWDLRKWASNQQDLDSKTKSCVWFTSKSTWHLIQILLRFSD